MQVSDYKDEIDRLNRELQDVKKKFYDQKKREMIQQDQKKGERWTVRGFYVWVLVVKRCMIWGEDAILDQWTECPAITS